MIKFFRRSVLSFILLAFVFANQGFVRAETNNGTVGASVSPPSFEIKANPGETRKDTIRLTNQSTSVITYEVKVDDFTVTGQEGLVAVQDESKDHAFSQWFSITPSAFQLDAGAAQYVNFVITVPHDAEPGGHFATVLFQPKVVAKKDVSGASVVQRVGSLILLTVSGQTKEQARIEAFHSKTYSGLWDDVTGSDGKTILHISKEEKLLDERASRYFSQGPMAFDVLYKNEGNVHVKPIGTVTIYNMRGAKVDELALDPRNVFPAGERRVTIVWPRKNLWGGYYRAQVIAVYGGNNQTMTSETWFLAFPLWAAILIAAGIVVILIARRRLIKVLKVLVRG